MLTPEQQKQVEILMPQALNIAKRHCPNDEDAGGVAYLALCHAMLKYDPARSVNPAQFCLKWVNGMLLNYRTEKWGGNGSRKNKALKLLTEQKLNSIPSHSDDIAAIEIEDLLSVLRPVDREIFRRVVLEDVPVSVICEERGTSDETVYRIIRR